ncbi:conjugal transfer transcriptional regulator TraJ [Caballeronia sp. LZ001]|uniref:conjugal transfer transcriptional regulator TraJ n=1 Tax=Caballeronia sp. LZ001 TaxID=3038553 RepID=UPI00285EEB98|nr:conjugal transfer transcriptional regulator TraJ [Caballeronia sp. LZ001]MDR5803491.1 conjugal transfer transcriptional regulator TraJ [Caballeronia sp. LZ001]
MNNEIKATRKGSTPIKVWCLPNKKANIEENARKAGMSVSMYLRNVGMGYRIKGVIDAELVLKLAKINGDQGRLGGLLKLWLTNSEKLNSQDPEQLRRVIHGVLERIVSMQIAMLDLVKAKWR